MKSGMASFALVFAVHLQSGEDRPSQHFRSSVGIGLYICSPDIYKSFQVFGIPLL